MTNASPSAVRAIGLAVPGAPHAQADLGERMMGLHGPDSVSPRLLRALYRRSGIATRHSCLDGEWGGSGRGLFRPLGEEAAVEGAGEVGGVRTDAPPIAPPGTARRMRIFAREAPRLAHRAVVDLLDRMHARAPDHTTAADIDHVIVTSCTGFVAPGLDVALVESVGLRSDVGRTLIGFQGCQAGLSALRVADAICRADPGTRVLVVCVELCTLHFQHEPTGDNLLANALFGDGAAAALVCGDAVEGSGPDLEIAGAVTELRPDDGRLMRWEVTDHGFVLSLSSLLPRALDRDLPELLTTITGSGHPDPTGRWWAVHPGGVAILDSVERAWALAPDALGPSREVLRNRGNMSSPTIFFVLEQFLAGVARDGEPGVAVAFGPGISIEAVRLRKRRGGA